MSDLNNLHIKYLRPVEQGKLYKDARLYEVSRPGWKVVVKVWQEGPEVFTATVIGAPNKVTHGRYLSHDTAILAHFAEHTDDQKRALAAGMDEGWRYSQDAGHDAFASLWTVARFFAEDHYPNGWNGGEEAAKCRAAFLGGWAIGVQRHADGVRADGSEQPFEVPGQAEYPQRPAAPVEPPPEALLHALPRSAKR